MTNIDLQSFYSLLRGKIGIIILFGLIISLLSFYAFIFTQKKYVVTTDYLIVQDQMGTQDFYSLSKSAEYLGGVLSEAVYSSVFVSELKNTGKIGDAYFSVSEKDLMKKWKKSVEIERSLNLGILKIKVYDNDKETAIGLSQGISEIMVTKNYLFRGKVNLDVRVLSGPIAEKNPSISKILLVTMGGFVLGALLKIMYIYYAFIMTFISKSEEEKYLNKLREME
jgi:capsular polysaccharide biosynthesis protein